MRRIIVVRALVGCVLIAIGVGGALIAFDDHENGRTLVDKTYRITDAVTADTYVLDHVGSVHVRRLDAPRGEECFASRARSEARRLYVGRLASVDREGDEHAHGALLISDLYISLRGAGPGAGYSLASDVLRRGLARVGVDRHELRDRAQTRARQAGRGLWRNCGSRDP